MKGKQSLGDFFEHEQKKRNIELQRKAKRQMHEEVYAEYVEPVVKERKTHIPDKDERGFNSSRNKANHRWFAFFYMIQKKRIVSYSLNFFIFPSSFNHYN